MDSLESIERIPVTDSLTFEQDFVRRQRPVIFTNLFVGQPIASLNTQGRIKRAFGNTGIHVVCEYYKDFVRSGSLFSAERAPSTIEGYLDRLEEEPRTPLLITEQTIPSAILGSLTVPELCRYRFGSDGTKELLGEMFLAGKGNVAHLHFDWDHRHVLLYQVFGRKRICLIHPKQSAILNPVLNMSLANLEGMNHKDRRAFIRYLGGYEETLRPGEAIYIPPLMWHYLEYIDTAMSIGLRFGRTKFGRICQERFHPNMFLQNFAWKAFGAESLSPSADRAFSRILSRYTNSAARGYSLYLEMEDIFQEVYREFCTDAVPSTFWHSLAELTTRQVKTAIKKKLLYGMT
jgi:hypothetical protein